MKYYTYIQNSSGGAIQGAKYVIIEAESPRHANFLAQHKADLYFGYRDRENDCNSPICCGDRWEKKDEHLYAYDEGTIGPMIYGEKATEYQTLDDIVIYRANGDRVHIR